jgi:predicted nucleic acid-binding Zn ribbon protein
MPNYDYQCTGKCRKIKEVYHPVSEIDNPTKETIKLTTCCKKRMERVFSLTSIVTETKSRF